MFWYHVFTPFQLESLISFNSILWNLCFLIKHWNYGGSEVSFSWTNSVWIFLCKHISFYWKISDWWNEFGYAWCWVICLVFCISMFAFLYCFHHYIKLNVCNFCIEHDHFSMLSSLYQEYRNSFRCRKLRNVDFLLAIGVCSSHNQISFLDHWIPYTEVVVLAIMFLVNKSLEVIIMKIAHFFILTETLWLIQ